MTNGGTAIGAVMTLSDAFRVCLRNCATFAGRAPRLEFWNFLLFVTMVLLIAGFLDRVVFAATGLGPTTIIALLAVPVSVLSVGWRRMHGTGQPGSPISLPLIVWSPSSTCRPSGSFPARIRRLAPIRTFGAPLILEHYNSSRQSLLSGGCSDHQSRTNTPLARYPAPTIPARRLHEVMS
jgi:uncharacterized membrane protein YhaH (DUF805 family)